MVAKVDNVLLTIIAAFAFFAATVGINMVANFIPPAYDLANLIPSKINFRIGGLITAGFGFVIGGLWVAVITQMGLFPFVNTLGAILAPVFGIMITDYYLIKKQKLNVDDLFSEKSSGRYHYNGGFNGKAMLAWVISGYVAVGSVWPNILPGGISDFFANLGGGGGYAWIIGASLGAILAPVFGIMITDYYIIKKQKLDVDDLFSDSPTGKYHYNGGFNGKGMLAWVLSGYIAVGTVWPNILFLGLDDFFSNLGGGGGYAWIIGASLGAVIHLAISSNKK